MGKTRFGGPTDLITWLRKTFQVSTFIETGTFMGNTSAWAAGEFEKVITIEGLETSHRLAKEKHGHLANVEFLLGDSRTLLPEVLSRPGSAPAIFWLDAHWMPNSYGEGAECPVLNEVTAVAGTNADHILLIDDARLFLTPPPRPHRATDWPDIAVVLKAIENFNGKPRRTFIYEDVIINVPESAGSATRDHLQDLTTDDMLAAANAPRPNLLKRALLRLAGANR